ncbi:uncharacterized protein RJT20DRAFT_128180 [Scheffersomyces xylosifermentans]|uniref:uncharacterized protein n=1 Tax=Scheffersomyces xylosifermentans TaxID=1304137 RepID=UPI00315DD560
MSRQNPNNSTTFGNSLSLRVDGAIGAMSLSPNGRDAVLAGRRGLFIIDLDDPFTTPRWLHHITSWEVADVQWSPHHFAKPSWCISTSNQKALLWDLARPSNNAILNVLHHHARAITDINFHPSDPEILATCSIDTFILSWDMRTPRKPVQKWAEWRAGTTQVKWNHENPFEIASSHDNCFYVWDTRKGALPLIKVNKAHDGKINGLDFSNGASNIITCSNDNTVKFWNLKSKEARDFAGSFDYFAVNDDEYSSLRPTVVIETDYPIARARALPFGKDKACGIMPLRGGEDSIHIVNYDTEYRDAMKLDETQVMSANPVYKFKGHNGPMKDFLWRTKHENYEGFESKNRWKEFQLVTWSSQDYDLKLWPRDDELYRKVNYNPSYHRFLDAFKSEDSDSEEGTRPQSTSPSEGDSKAYAYQTYCIEPPVTIDDLKRRNNGDILSSLTLYQISEKHKLNGHDASQLNHLDWISGVRMGRAGHGHESKDGTLDDEEDGPSNLGEEISIVGHKFPKARFEKISVSTGEIVLSLRGPVPAGMSPKNPEKSSEANDDVSNNSVNEKESSTQAEKSQKPTSVISTEGVDIENTSKNIASVPSVNEEFTSEQELVFIRIQIKFPKEYPYLEEIPLHENISSKKLNRIQKHNLIKFDIEETHELSAELKVEMIRNLNEIAHFYSNKYQRFCLEPCLRYLLGDKIELNDDLMIDSRTEGNEDNLDAEGYIHEVGNEGWADDLINQQPNYEQQMRDDSSGEEDEGYTDLIPPINGDMLESVDSLTKANSTVAQSPTEGFNNASAKATIFDSTPVPKGCGAVWSPTGQLVCFFIPKESEEEENNSLQKFNIFKFTDGGFSVNTHSSHHHSHHHHKVSEDSSDTDSDGSAFGSDDTSNSEGGDSDAGTSSSDDSFTNDWDDILQDDAPARSRIPGLFKTSVGLGNRYIAHGNNKSSINRFASQGGTASNYKSSVPGDNKSKRNRDSKKSKNIVGIFDFRHLLPDKYELACEYRVLGDSPENLAHYNSEVALKYGLKDISDVWKILEMILIKSIKFQDLDPAFYPPNLHQNMRQKDSTTNQLLQSSTIARHILPYKHVNFYWGTHPFGHTWLVDEIFQYFEKKGNIQMLSMMSCILYENPSNFRRNTSDLFNIPIHTPYQALPPPPSLIAMKKFNENNSQAIFSHSHDLSYSFHDSLTTEGKVPEYFSQNRSHRNSSTSFFRKDQLSVTGIPDARSIASSLDAASLKDGSPERHMYLKKNIQPSFNSFTPLSEYQLQSDIPRELNRFNSPKQRIQKAKTTSQLAEKRSKGIPNISKRQIVKVVGKNKIRPPPTVTVEMQNTDKLDLFDDVYTSSLLHSQDEHKIKLYREQYADMLYVWGLPVNRIKILKFNYPDVEEKSLTGYISPFNVHKCSIGMRGKSRQNPNQEFLSFVTPIPTARSNAWNTSKRSNMKYCNLCNLVVSKTLVVCTNCEHVLHTSCAAEWWPGEAGREANTECPSGCGCHCLEYTI